MLELNTLPTETSGRKKKEEKNKSYPHPPTVNISENAKSRTCLGWEQRSKNRDQGIRTILKPVFSPCNNMSVTSFYVIKYSTACFNA